jgi:hypothetical protein
VKVLAVSDSRKRTDSTAAGSPAVPRTITPSDVGVPTVARTTTPSSPHPIGTPSAGMPPVSAAVAAWLRDRGIYPATGKPWRVQIALEVNDRPATFGFAATKLHITIEPASWGYVFTHGDRTSTIHVTTFATARDQDEHRLLAMTPALKRFGTLVRDLEARYRIFFPRHHAALRTDLPGGEPMIRAWLSSL